MNLRTVPRRFRPQHSPIIAPVDRRGAARKPGTATVPAARARRTNLNFGLHGLDSVPGTRMGRGAEEVEAVAAESLPESH
jgi:hypothetical protein